MLPNANRPEVIGRLAIQHEMMYIMGLSGNSDAVEQEDRMLTQRFASRLLQLTRWVSEVGLKGGADIMGRYRLINKLAPDWENGKF